MKPSFYNFSGGIMTSNKLSFAEFLMFFNIQIYYYTIIFTSRIKDDCQDEEQSTSDPHFLENFVNNVTNDYSSESRYVISQIVCVKFITLRYLQTVMYIFITKICQNMLMLISLDLIYFSLGRYNIRFEIILPYLKKPNYHKRFNKI